MKLHRLCFIIAIFCISTICYAQPAAPNLYPVSGPSSLSTIIMWDAVPGNITFYLLDISTDNFSTFVQADHNYNSYPVPPSFTSLVTWPVIGLPTGFYQARVRAMDNTNQISTYSNVVSFYVPLAQTVTLDPIPAKTFGDPPFVVSATASSGLPISYYYTSPSAIASVSGNTVTIKTAGTVQVCAVQNGNGTYDFAQQCQSVTISKASQTITFNTLAVKTFGDASFDLTATASSGLTISYSSSDPTVASISGKTVTLLKAGSVTITASQSGNINYTAAASVPQDLVINKSDQTISFDSLAQKTFGSGSFDLTATASSGLDVSYSSSDPSIASVSGKTVTLLKTGSVTITASQAGDANYNAASGVVQTLTINKSDQTISFGVIAEKTIGDAAFDLTATTSSGLTVTYSSSDTAIASITGKTLSLVKAGSVTITASQVGDSNYNVAPDVQQTFCIDPQKPVIALSGENTASVTLTSNSDAGNQWYLNDSTISGAIDPSYSVNAAGSYTVRVTTGGCQSASSDAVVIIVTAIEQSPVARVYPNAVKDFLTIKWQDASTGSLSVFDNNGKAIISDYLIVGDSQLDLRSLTPGIYLVRLKGSTAFTTRIIKE